ncbi:ADP/ATP-dependent (S)-NAD(P)H-hydrate dehydratase [Diaminobutyricimonas sp. LJ205]|uniref:ADP-dependent NAD(P)H-hydrate dehydratase n=1 Tax=Diaminobutyricimonas sp. LJ205 TaxID=2683590 RepID=UPI0012F4EFCB|nr:ADP/ATP-dependent (S)-NAD(P)H-hydrate dehydratase [Diaminobutyricimonas sp. LJ205]
MVTLFTAVDAAELIVVPTEQDDKYSRGVLGVLTGSVTYPGAAVLSVEAALRTGVGMVRYLGPSRARRLVLARRPEVVTVDGRVQAWLCGSGMDQTDRHRAVTARLSEAIDTGVPLVLDAGALDLVPQSVGPTVLTPHAGELALLLGVDRADVTADPVTFATRAADEFAVTVLLKGHTTYVVGAGAAFEVRSAPTWLATAGAGDALGGILGALVATHAAAIHADKAVLPRLAATASVIHGLAATRASGGGPFTVLDLAEAIPATIVDLLALRDIAG